VRGRAAVLLSFIAVATAYGEDPPARDGTRKIGAYTLSGTPAELVGAEAAKSISAVLSPDATVTWEVVVPEGYDPARPAGLLVYISPSDSGQLPRGWGLLLEDRNLIWVAANRSGNRQHVARRIALAVLATGALAGTYAIDPARVYLSGYSGGARVAGLLAPSYPAVFRGALYIGGAELWDQPDGPPNLQAMRLNRYAFLVGSDDDANRVIARRVQDAYLAAGISDTEMIIARRTGHAIPELRYVSAALDFLDAASGATGER